jgi:hypothetical protein
MRIIDTRSLPNNVATALLMIVLVAVGLVLVLGRPRTAPR